MSDIHTQVPCVRCGHGVRARYAVAGMCHVCAAESIGGLERERDDLTRALAIKQRQVAELEADARRGRLVLRMAPDSLLRRLSEDDGWVYDTTSPYTRGDGTMPEDALTAAGVRDDV